ncbi:DUF3017 domain-containing protein [Streptomyces sp. NPDC052052]|uniref:DUF3017 domain-containing protein n=1 Tax=Streptomyces sp. NPDC052052 TaxID=3154756 RepID=UPI00343A5749
MGAGTSPADPAAEADRTSPEAPSDVPVSGTGAADAAEAARDRAEAGEAAGAGADAAGTDAGADPEADAAESSGENPAENSDVENSGVGNEEADTRPGTSADAAAAATGPGGGAPAEAPRGTSRPSRRFSSITRGTARPEGGGRAASGDAPAPARQWPLLAVLCTAGIGLLIVAVDPFAEAFRVGTMVIGAALIGGAVLRVMIPSVGMLAVRSRFTDLVTYGVLGVLIVMLALVAQPEPWLDIPFLEHAVHFTIR